MKLLEPFYKIKIDISDYQLIALNDIIRMFIIQVVVQILIGLKNNSLDVLTSNFIETTLFILIGVFVYWFVFNYVLVFTNKKEVDTDDYYQMKYTV